MSVLAEFSLGDLILSLLWIFFLVVFFWLLITIFSDLWRDQNLSGWAKALWVIFVIVFPFIGILIYLIVRGGSMHDRAIAEQKRAQAAFDDYVQSVAGGGGGGGAAEELAKLADLKDKGVLSDNEFQRLKAKLVG